MDVASSSISNTPMVRSTSERIGFFVLLLFGVVMYTAPGEYFPVLAPYRLALVTSIGALVFMLISRVGNREPVLIGGVPGWALILITGLSFASSAWSMNPEGAISIAIDCAKYVGIYLTIINLARTQQRVLMIAGALVIASIATSTGVIDWYYTGVDLVEGYRARWIGLYADPNRMAMSVAMVVPIAAAIVVRRQSGWLLRALALVAAVLAIMAVVFSHSRGGFVGLSVAMVVWALRERSLGKKAMIGVAAVALLLLAPASFWSRTESVSGFREDVSAMGRVHAWSVAAAISADKPLVGVGAASFRRAWPFYAPPEAYIPYEAHNIFLQVLAELGWIGFALFLVFVGGTVDRTWRAGRDRGDDGWLARALVASAVGYLISSLSSGFLGSSPHMFVLFGLAHAAAEARWATAGSKETALVAASPSPRGQFATP